MTDVRPGTKFRHIGTGRIYVLEHYATIEATMTPAVVYRAVKDKSWWVRPASEFFDGRFEYFPRKQP